MQGIWNEAKFFFLKIQTGDRKVFEYVKVEIYKMLT